MRERCIQIVDCTLRDGEQAPGIVFSVQEKLKISALLSQFGVAEIEAGIPAMGEQEQEELVQLQSLNLNSCLVTWSRAVLGDIRLCSRTGIGRIHISLPVSDLQIKYKLGKDRMWVLNYLRGAVRYATDLGLEVSVGAEDASRADMDFVMIYAALARDMGAIRLRYADTVGTDDPFSTCERIKRLAEVGIPLEFHGHNDFGMALANTLGAIRGGVEYVSTTVLGIGERAGNVSLEDLIQAITLLPNYYLEFNAKFLPDLINIVELASGRKSHTLGRIV